MLQLDDVLKAWRQVWLASGALTLAVPGGLWHERADEGATAPYARIGVEEGDPQWTSGSDYLIEFTVTVTVWSRAGAANAGLIRAAILAAFNHETKGQLSLPKAGARVVHLLPVGGKVEVEAMQKESKDVLATAQRWKVLCQGRRP